MISYKMLCFGIESPEDTTKKELLGPAASEPEQLTNRCVPRFTGLLAPD
jgi:hypothetical protein